MIKSWFKKYVKIERTGYSDFSINLRSPDHDRGDQYGSLSVSIPKCAYISIKLPKWLSPAERVVKVTSDVITPSLTYDKYLSQHYGFCYLDHKVHLNLGGNVNLMMSDDFYPEVMQQVKEGKLRCARPIFIEMPWSLHFSHRDTPLYNETLPFKYPYPVGRFQETSAKVIIYDAYWKWKIFNGQKLIKLCSPFMKRVRRVSVEFENEVGTKVDTWKGGCLSITMPLPRENMDPAEVLQWLVETKHFHR